MRFFFVALFKRHVLAGLRPARWGFVFFFFTRTSLLSRLHSETRGAGSGWMVSAFTPEASGRGSRERSSGGDQRRRDLGTHAGCSFQIFTSSAVRPASRMSRLTRDTLPAVDYRQIALHITRQRRGERSFSQSRRVELLAPIRVNGRLLDAQIRTWLRRPQLNVAITRASLKYPREGFWSTPLCFFAPPLEGAASVTCRVEVGKLERRKTDFCLELAFWWELLVCFRSTA